MTSDDRDEPFDDEVLDEVIDAAMEAAVDDLTDRRIRALAAESYHEPPVAPRERMWDAISARRQPDVIVRQLPRRRRSWWPQAVGIAATLLVGVGIGHVLTRTDDATAPTLATADGSRDADTAPLFDDDARRTVLQQATLDHLARAEALLVNARVDLASGTADRALDAWARDALGTTRLLLDVPDLADPRTQQLLRDLELVLAQLVQARASGRPTDARALQSDLDDGDLLARLRAVAADPYATLSVPDAPSAAPTASPTGGSAL